MRGYRMLKDSASLCRITSLNNELVTHPLNIPKTKFSSRIFGAGIDEAEAVCRQILLTRIAGIDQNASLLRSISQGASPIARHIPPQWHSVFRKHGFNISPAGCAIRWNLYAAAMLLVGGWRICRIIINGIKAVFAQLERSSVRYAYFDALANGNLPKHSKDNRSYDVISWYLQWEGKANGVDTIIHGVPGAEAMYANRIKVFAAASPIPPLAQLPLLGRFISWAFRAILEATVDLVRGRWWHAILLPQAALAAQVRMLDADFLAREYLFHNSGYIYRPLWSYEAEKKGSKVTFYFYSTNCELFKRQCGYPLPFGWGAMTWPHYLVWDEYQKEFIYRAVGENAVVTVVGAIPFSASAKDVPAFAGAGIAVFDITPHRASRYRTLGLDFEFYIPETSISFLRHIQAITNSAGYKMLWKRKRKIGKIAHPLYRQFTDEIADSENIIIVDPDISAHRVIESSIAVISMPFTSTALIAREIGKPSCYYDPLGLLLKDDRGAHGIPIIAGPQELVRWLNQISGEGSAVIRGGHP